jgi:hypothetical protein
MFRLVRFFHVSAVARKSVKEKVTEAADVVSIHPSLQSLV